MKVKYEGTINTVVPYLGSVAVVPGEELVVTEAQAKVLLMVSALWVPADAEAEAVTPEWPSTPAMDKGLEDFTAEQVVTGELEREHHGIVYKAKHASYGETPDEAKHVWDEISPVPAGYTPAESEHANSFLGGAAMKVVKEKGEANVAVGEKSGTSVTTGAFNTSVGFSSLKENATGNNNVAIGASALLANTANSNTAVGTSAAAQNSTGEKNTAVGSAALGNNQAGQNNTAVGNQAGASLKSDDNTLVGSIAGASLTTGEGNVVVGMNALSLGKGGECTNNVVVGQNAMGTASVKDHNVAIGSEAGEQNEGRLNTFVGRGAGRTEKGSNKLVINAGEKDLVKGEGGEEPKIAFLGATPVVRHAKLVTLADAIDCLVKAGLAEA